MKVRSAVIVAMALCCLASAGFAQQTGEIYGKVTDASGAVLPGVTVTLHSPVLLQPLTAVTTATGTYRFPQLPIGIYTVKFELTGFKTVLKRRHPGRDRPERRRSTRRSRSRRSQETVTVAGETPLVDPKDTSKTDRFTQEALQSIPSARDPWVIIEQSAGVAMDRQNVGGSAVGPAVELRRARRGDQRSRSGTSTASTSPTCPRRAARPCTSTSTRSRRCRSRPAAPT